MPDQLDTQSHVEVAAIRTYCGPGRPRSIRTGTGCANNACDRCGTQLWGSVRGFRWSAWVGHPWPNSGEWWCRSCLEAEGYDVRLVVDIDRARSRSEAEARALAAYRTPYLDEVARPQPWLR